MLRGRLIELDHFDILAEWGDERRDTPLRRVCEVCEAVILLVTAYVRLGVWNWLD